MLRLGALKSVWVEKDGADDGGGYFLGFVESGKGDWVPVVVPANVTGFRGPIAGFVRRYRHITDSGLCAESFARYDEAPFLWRFCDASAELPKWSVAIQRDGEWWSVPPDRHPKDLDSPEHVEFHLLFDPKQPRKVVTAISVTVVRNRDSVKLYEFVIRSSDSPRK